MNVLDAQSHNEPTLTAFVIIIKFQNLASIVLSPDLNNVLVVSISFKVSSDNCLKSHYNSI